MATQAPQAASPIDATTNQLQAGAASAANGQRPYLYVGNLSPRVTETMLKEIFTVSGPVQSVKIVSDTRNTSPNALNYGFVEYVDMRCAEAALQTLNGRNVFDIEIKVNWAKHGNPQQQNEDFTPTGGKEDLSGLFHVFVGDLAPEINDATLRQAFASYPSIAEVRVMWDMNSGKSRGYGFVSFKDKADAEQSIATMNGEWLGSRAIRVNWANQKSLAAHRNLNQNQNHHHHHHGRNGMVNGGAGMGGPMMRMSPGMHMPAHMPAMPYGAGASGAAAGQPLTYEQILNLTPPSVSTVYCGNLAPFTTQNDVMAVLSVFGYIVEVRMQSDRGYAFVKLDSHEHAANAIYTLSLNGCNVHGRPVKLSWGKERNDPSNSATAAAANALSMRGPVVPISPAAAAAVVQGQQPAAMGQQYGTLVSAPYN